MLPRIVLLITTAAVTGHAWPATLTAEPTGDATHQDVRYPSSSSVRINWSAPTDADVHHYVINAQERRSGTQSDVAPGVRDVILTGLKAATEYTIYVRACLDALCESVISADEPARIVTPPEYWRISGAGRSYASATRVVSDGNVGAHVFRYGPWAGPEKDGALQLYYTPIQREEKGAKLGRQSVPNNPPPTDPVEAAISFEPVSGYGLLRGCSDQPGVPSQVCLNSPGLATGVALYQAVPLAADAQGGGQKVRLFFESLGRGNRTRILYLDSQDGYAGRDFHRGAPTRCETLADYEPGGGCEPAVAIGVDIDSAEAGGNPNLQNTRQFKIAFPTAVSTAWDLAPGTLMWFTTEWRDGRCSAFGFNAAYAVWNGTSWKVQYAENGCPKVLPGVQAPAPVHVGANGSGAARYKLYFSRHTRPGGPTDPRVAIKPVELLYADPEVTGDPAVTDFEDWEPLDSSRNVRFLWPDGTLLTEDEESRFDDFFVLAPGPDLTRLIMYSNMSFTGLNAMPFIGAAILVNP